MPRAPSEPNRNPAGLELAHSKRKIRDLKAEVDKLKRSIKTGNIDITLLKNAIAAKDEMLVRLMKANDYLTRTEKSEDE
jgi:hypothetical protein